MKKEIYIIGPLADETRDEFSARLLEKVPSLCAPVRPTALWLTLAVSPPRFHLIPFQDKKLAAVSIKGDKETYKDLFEGFSGLLGGYSVDEALPISYHRDWPALNASPGVGLLTLFRKKRNLEQATFIDRWHNGHTPLTLEIHPISHYVRNVVKEATIEASIPYDGIVEEHVRTSSDLLNPFRFFGTPSRALVNMIRVYKDIRGFIDLSSIETFLVREYHLN